MHTVLLIDDEPLIVESLKRAVPWGNLGCTVIGDAKNGAEALDIIYAQEPDIVVTDIRMPLFDGLGLLQALQNLAKKPSVIVLTGYDQFEYAREALKHGVTDYLLKPVDIEELEKSVRKAVDERQRAERAGTVQLKHLLYEVLTGRPLHTQDAVTPPFYQCVLFDVSSAHDAAVDTLLKYETWSRNTNIQTFWFQLRDSEITIVLAGETSRELSAAAHDMEAHLRSEFGQRLNVVTTPAAYGIAALFGIYRDAAGQLENHRFRSEEPNAVKLVDTDADDRMSRMVSHVLQHVAQHFREDISLESAAQIAGVSPGYFSAQFKSVTGRTFSEHVTQLRMEEACRLLGQTTMKSREIAREVGYPDARYFSQVFRRHTGKTPREYRKAHEHELG